MKNIWAKNKTTGVMDADITATNTMFAEQGLSEDTHDRYFTDDQFVLHVSGEPLYKDDGMGGHMARTNTEILTSAGFLTKYKLAKWRELKQFALDNQMECSHTMEEIRTKAKQFKAGLNGLTTQAQIDNACDNAKTYLSG